MAQSLSYKLKQDFIPDDLVDTINAFLNSRKQRIALNVKNLQGLVLKL